MRKVSVPREMCKDTGMSMVLSKWIITPIYKLVVSPVSRLKANLLTSY